MSLERLRQILADFFARLSKRREESPTVRLPKIRAERETLIRQRRTLNKRTRRYRHVARRLGELTLEELQIVGRK